MNRPEKKELNLPGVLETLGATEMHEQELINKHYNQGRQDMIDFLPNYDEIKKICDKYLNISWLLIRANESRSKVDTAIYNNACEDSELLAEAIHNRLTKESGL